MADNWIDESMINLSIKGHINTLAENMKLPPAIVIQNMLIRRIAEEDAESSVYGAGPKALMEFMSHDGELVTGQALFDFIYESEKKRLENEVVNNHMAVPWEGCSDDVKEILTKHGYGPIAEQKKAEEKRILEEGRKKYNIPKRKPGENSHWEA